MRVNVIIPCGGKGQRFGDTKNKVLCNLLDSPIIEHSLLRFAYHPQVTLIIIPCSRNDKKELDKIISKIVCNCQIITCEGGSTRTSSVANALALTETNADIISVHDGARPYVTEEIINDSFNQAYLLGSGIAGYSSIDTVAVIDSNGQICDIPPRETIFIIQTPQSFKAKLILQAYSMISNEDNFTDDSSVYAKYIASPSISLGSPNNRKITYPGDLTSDNNMFVGTGYDTHRLVPNRDLVLGGINIPYHLGLLGHSDADVLTHAIMDAILSACNERDIGVLFPDTDPKYKGIESTKLLDYVCKLVYSKGYRIKNISSVIMCEKPKMSPIITDMRKNLAKIIDIEHNAINISATTTEGLGWVGREEGIASRATCLCYKIKE